MKVNIMTNTFQVKKIQIVDEITKEVNEIKKTKKNKNNYDLN